MRNPVRLKNLRLRFLPLIAVSLLLWLWVSDDPVDLALGGGLVMAGLALRGWGAGHLIKTKQLTTSGPYAHVRHPLYLGSLLCATGFALMAGGVVGPAILVTSTLWFVLVYFPRKDRKEADRLEAVYAADFVRYRAAVPALLPRLAAWRAPWDAGASAGRWRGERYSENNELGTALGVSVGLAAMIARAAFPMG